MHDINIDSSSPAWQFPHHGINNTTWMHFAQACWGWKNIYM
jgi:hypothetical protein